MPGEWSGATTSHALGLWPGATRTYFDESSGQTVEMRVSSRGQNKILVDAQLPNGRRSQFDLQCDRPLGTNLDTCQWTLLKAGVDGAMTFTFGKDGLRLPMNLVAGDAIEAEPNEMNPATGNKVKLFINVIGPEKVKVRKELPLDQEGGYLNHLALKCAIVVRDQGLGTVLVKYEVWLLPGMGVVRAAGQVFGVFAVLALTNFHTPA